MILPNVDPVVGYAIGGIIGILTLATIIVWSLQRVFPPNLSADLKTRIKGWWIMIGIFSIAMLLSRKVSLAFFAFVSFLALKEYFALIPTRRADRRILFWAYLAIPIQYYWIATGWYGMFVLFIPVYMFLFLPFRMILIGETQGYLRAISTIQWGLMTMVFCLSHLAWLLIMPVAEHAGHSSGPALVLYLVFLTQANDILQYIWGKSFGRTKVVPTVSPNKTWIGLLGGVATTMVLAHFLAPYFTPLSPRESWFAGFIIGAGGFIGDCAMAALKRDLGVKDYSSAIPGHGGVIDRINSLIYTAPLFLHFLRYTHF